MPNTARADIFAILGQDCHCGTTAIFISPRPAGGTWAEMLQSVTENPGAYRPVCATHRSAESPRQVGRPQSPDDPLLSYAFREAANDTAIAGENYRMNPSPDNARSLEATWHLAKAAHRALNQSAQFRRHLNGG